MAIQRWDPLRDLQQLQENMNRMFSEALSHSAAPASPEAVGGAGWKPPTDLFEEFGRYVLRADLPGIAPSDVDIRIEDGRLILRGERRKDTSVAQESYLRVERPEGRFAVQVSLPSSVDPANIKAAHHNGVLEVVLPKKQGHPVSRIEVSGGQENSR